MKKVAVLSLLPVMLMLNGAALADDAPAEPTAPATDDSRPVDAGVADGETQPADPVGEAEAAIDDAVERVDEDPAGTVSLLIELAKSGRWGPFAGLLVMFLVWVGRKWIWKYIPRNVLPWLTLSLSMVVSVAVGLIAENVWWKVLIDGLLTGGSAMALWSAVFKHFMKPKEAT